MLHVLENDILFISAEPFRLAFDPLVQYDLAYESL